MDYKVDTQNIINIIAAAAIGSGGWFARELWGAVKDLRQNVHDIEVDLPKSYVSKIDIDKRMDHIDTMVQRIYDKLDGKADK
jgi:hypothetical protein